MAEFGGATANVAVVKRPNWLPETSLTFIAQANHPIVCQNRLEGGRVDFGEGRPDKTELGGMKASSSWLLMIRK